MLDEHLLPKDNETEDLDLPGVIEELGSSSPKSIQSGSPPDQSTV
jgi:hypothetical protein